MEGHAQIKQGITEKTSKKLMELLWLQGKILVQNSLSEKGLEFFSFNYTKYPKFRNLQFSFNYEMELRHHNTNDSEVFLP